jgi:hypothetical protein
MDNNQYRPFVTIYCDIVNESGSDTTVELPAMALSQNSSSSPSHSSPSPPALTPIYPSSVTTHCEEQWELPSTTGPFINEHPPPCFSPIHKEPPPMETSITTNNNVCNKFDSLKTRVVQDISRSRDIDNERRAVVELNKNLLTIRALFARREILRTFLREQMPRPVPRGEENFLNSRFDGGATLLHTSVKQLKYDIVDLMLIYGADANIIENEKTMAHLAAENNDTLLFKILHRHKADFSLWNKDGETPIMVAIALKNKEITKMLYTYQPIHTSSANNETVLHYAARNNYLSAAEVGCDSSQPIDINQQSTTELRTALHIAVQYSNMEIIDVLLKAGARDDWEDRYGRRAYEYIVDDAIYALFSQYGMKFDQNSSVSANNKKNEAHTSRRSLSRY